MNIRIIHGLAGAVNPHHRPGDKDRRLESALNVSDLYEVLISAVLFYNNNHYIKDYPMRREMIADGVKPYPAQLYRWGIENNVGTPRTRDRDDVRVALLPSGMATVTNEGIQFGRPDQIYTCRLAEEQEWSLKAKKTWNVRVAYEPRCADIIYLRPGNGAPSIPCHLKDRESPYKGLDWKEINDYIKYKKLEKARAYLPELKLAMDLDEQVEGINTRAVTRTREHEAVSSKESKTAQLKQIGTNKQNKIAITRAEEAQQLLAKEFPDLAAGRTNTLVDDTNADDSRHVGIAEVVDLTEQRRKRMRNEQG